MTFRLPRTAALSLTAALAAPLLAAAPVHAAPSLTAPSLTAPSLTAPSLTAAGPTTAAALLSAPVVTGKSTAPIVTRYVTKTVNVRSGPTTRYPVIGTLSRGAKVSGAYHSNGAFRLGASRYVSGSVLSTTAPSAKVTGTMVVQEAAKYAGIYYVYGGNTPTGFDCSGYTQYVHKRLGVSLPRTVADQRRVTTRISTPKTGDLVFFGTYHAAIYAGNGYIWDSGKPGLPVQKRKIWSYADVSYGRVSGVSH